MIDTFNNTVFDVSYSLYGNPITDSSVTELGELIRTAKNLDWLK